MRQLVLWIDDMRNPHSEMWKPVATNKKYVQENPIIAWVKDYFEFCNWLDNATYDPEVLWPAFVCFDHDLGEEKTGLDCAKYLVNVCMTNNMPLPAYTCHSSNPVGAQNILSYLNSYKKSLE